MPNCHKNKKGVILFIVIGVILVVIILATVTLRMIASQARLTHHQVSRIQAQYAAKAGMLYALEKVRRNAVGWVPTSPVPVSKFMCSPTASTDSDCNCSAAVIEPDLPKSIKCVEITIYPASSGKNKVSAKAIYTYSP